MQSQTKEQDSNYQIFVYKKMNLNPQHFIKMIFHASYENRYGKIYIKLHKWIYYNKERKHWSRKWNNI